MRRLVVSLLIFVLVFLCGCGDTTEVRDRETIQAEIDALQKELDAMDQQTIQDDLSSNEQDSIDSTTDNTEENSNADDDNEDITDSVKAEDQQIVIPDGLKSTKIGRIVSESPNIVYPLNGSIPCGLVLYDIGEKDIIEYFGEDYSKETDMPGHLKGGDFRLAYSNYELAGVEGDLNFVFMEEKLIGVCLFSYSSENIEEDNNKIVTFVEQKTGLEPFTYTIGDETTTTLNEVRKIDYLCAYRKDENFLHFEVDKNGVIETAQEAKTRIDHEIDVAEQKAEWGEDTYNRLNENLGKQDSSKKTDSYSDKTYSTMESLSSDDTVLYWTIAKDEVKKRLKSPSTAKFPFAANSEGVSITKSGDYVTVNAYVDAQNSFGAMLRSNFVVRIRLDGTKYSVESCVID